MVLCSDTVGDLQKQLCVLEQHCIMWGMTVNLTKSRIVVFRKGDTLRDNEMWYYNKQRMEVVANYKYLGVMFSNTLQWVAAQNALTKQGNKALINVYKLDSMCGGMPPPPPVTAFNLFHKIVVPVLCYGADVCG